MHGRKLTIEEIKTLKKIMDGLMGKSGGFESVPSELFWTCSLTWWELHDAEGQKLGLRRIA